LNSGLHTYKVYFQFTALVTFGDRGPWTIFSASQMARIFGESLSTVFNVASPNPFDQEYTPLFFILCQLMSLRLVFFFKEIFVNSE
jgi:hypothetical protein